jgi:hypothetical protein
MDSNPRSPAYDEFGAPGRAHATHAAIVKPRKPIVRVGERFAARLSAFHIDKVGLAFEIGFGDFEHHARHPAPPPKSPRPERLLTAAEAGRARGVPRRHPALSAIQRLE